LFDLRVRITRLPENEFISGAKVRSSEDSPPGMSYGPAEHHIFLGSRNSRLHAEPLTDSATEPVMSGDGAIDRWQALLGGPTMAKSHRPSTIAVSPRHGQIK